MQRFLNSLSPTRTRNKFIYSALLVLLTFNPTGYSMGEWLYNDLDNFANVWVGFLIRLLFLAILWIIFIGAVIKAVHPFVLGLVILVFSLIIYFPFWKGYIAPDVVLIEWGVLLVFIGALSFGASISGLRFKFFGQRSVDHVIGDEVNHDHG